MKILLLLSGGLDSAVCLAQHKHLVDAAIGFSYGQSNLIELIYAEKIAQHYHIPFSVVSLNPMPLINEVVRAGRNAVMLSSAVAIAQANGIDTIMFGANQSDAERFPDCRPEFVASFSDACFKAYGVAIYAPLLNTPKSKVLKLAKQLGVPQTWSCYTPKDEAPCGECYACKSLTPA